MRILFYVYIFSLAIKPSKNFDEIKIFQRNPSVLQLFGGIWVILGNFRELASWGWATSPICRSMSGTSSSMSRSWHPPSWTASCTTNFSCGTMDKVTAPCIRWCNKNRQEVVHYLMATRVHLVIAKPYLLSFLCFLVIVFTRKQRNTHFGVDLAYIWRFEQWL